MAALASYLYVLPVAAQITDPARWLVQARCADGSPPNHCDFPAPQRISDPVYYSRHDWPPPIGHSFSHRTLGTDATFVQNFRFADGGFGGQALYINGETVLAYKTQDAGKINTYYFTGPNCGGTGWIIFDVNVPKTRWAELRKELSGVDAVPPRRYRFSFFENGRPLLVTVDTIVSEHYDDRDPIVARLMERFYFGYNWSWLRWERWEKTGSGGRRHLPLFNYILTIKYDNPTDE